jgi:hypothetical protein
MENIIYKKIIGHEKLTNIFGYWPSFHDAEVISIILEKIGKDEREGPVLYAKIHVFQMDPEKTNGGKKFVFHCHSIVTFRFTMVKNLLLNEFNHQNVIFGLKISEKYDEERKKNLFEVEFEHSFGISCSFICDNIEITDIVKKIPKYSIYQKP